MESIIYRYPELEASFSFCCYDVNSAIHVFSDDEAGVNDNEYIEIALEKTRNITYDDNDDIGSSDQELDLRISFSSTSVPFFEINNDKDNNIGFSRTYTVESVGNFLETVLTPSSSSSSSMNSKLSCSSRETYTWAAGTGPSRLTHDKKTIKQRVQFRAINRLFSGFLSTPRTEIVEKDDTVSDENSRQIAIENNIHKLEPLWGRKAAKMATKTTNGGKMMKFLIKCRSINVRELLASFMKPYQTIKNSPQAQKKKRSKWLVQKDGANGERSKVLDINLDPIKGVLGSMGTSFGRKDRRTNSPISCCNNKNSLTIRQQRNCYTAGESATVYARDNSIQAAIAHCKRSFGQTSEFSF